MRKSGGAQGSGGRLRAVGYVRVSTDQQALEGVSLDAQQVRIRAHCVSQDIELTDIVIDDGFSAKSLERPGIKRALAIGSDFAAPSVLSAYERTHRLATLPLFAATHAVAKIYTNESMPARLLRDGLLAIGERVTPFKRLIAASLTGAR